LQEFCTWFLSLNSEQQRALLLRCCPDMPEQSPFARESAGESLNATDIILPEFSLDSMLASAGRIFILFMTRRLASADLSMADDIKMMQDLYNRKVLPSFSGKALEGQDTAFVDPTDPTETIRSLAPNTPEDKRNAILENFKTNRLVRAEVWLALKIRRLSIAALLESLAEEHYQAAAVKPSPSYTALLESELLLQADLIAQCERNEAGLGALNNEELVLHEESS
jgi:hypothetical protein